MNFDDRIYPDIVRDLLTVLTGGTVAESISIGSTVPDLLYLEHRPVRRVSHLQGKIQTGEALSDYRFTERDFELVGTDENPDQFTAIRFRDRGHKPAPMTQLTVNYYPERVRPTPVTDVNVGSVARTLIETISRELATQYRQLQKVYESAFIETASGSSLDKVVALVDTRRILKGHSVGTVRFSRKSGSPGSVYIPVNTAVSDGQGSRYLTSHDGTLQSNQASVEVWVYGANARIKPVDTGALTVMERAIAGIDRVTNDEPTYRSTEDETDEQLAARARGAIHTTGKGTRDAIRYGLESFTFVNAVTLTEYPDSSVSMPGILRVDVALSEDNNYNRGLIDRRIRDLRPAGIYIDRHWAESTTLAFHVDLVLAGATLATSVVADIKDGVISRLGEYARGLGPGDSLRKARLSALVLEDENVVDATVAATADGTAITDDTWPLPTGKTAALDSTDPVTFGTVAFEEAGDEAQFVLVHADADVYVSDISVDSATLESIIQASLSSLLGSLQSGDTIDFDSLAAGIRDDALFVLVREQSVFVFDQEGGGFTELRDNDPPFTVPVNSTLAVRAVNIHEVVS